MTHTPGPWIAEPLTAGAIAIVPNPQNKEPSTSRRATLREIADTFGEEYVNNAELLAAAPTLLAALEEIAEINDPKTGDKGPTKHARHIAKCAIATLKGPQ